MYDSFAASLQKKSNWWNFLHGAGGQPWQKPAVGGSDREIQIDGFMGMDQMTTNRSTKAAFTMSVEQSFPNAAEAPFQHNEDDASNISSAGLSR